MENFIFGKILGKGSFGQVCLVKRKEDGQIYAMKQVKIQNLSDKEKQNTLNEIRILASLSHKNIIGYKDSFFDENSKTLNIVMEYADDGDLLTKIKDNIKNRVLYKENVIWFFFVQILEGLNFLHENKIIHRDLKNANIFLTKDGIVKIGDLNVSKITKKNEMATTQTGTPYYVAPEIWMSKPYEYKCDIWSLGCILYELCKLKPPFRGTNIKILAKNIKEGTFEPISNVYSNDLKNIINSMLRKDPNERPTAKELINGEIVQNKIKEYKLGNQFGNINNIQYKGLMGTIKVPPNIEEINKNLPGNKYNNRQRREEMLIEDEYETNRRKNEFINEEHKKEVKRIFGGNIINNKQINNNFNNFKLNNNISNINNRANIFDNNVNILQNGGLQNQNYNNFN
jgi:NIMA (never in mitosis gene a)-related kinase